MESPSPRAQLPAISVLMPVYNAGRFLKEATESILNQTYDDFEFIIVDDGSTDESLDLLERFAAQDKRIRLISRPNTGHTIALNEMLGLARAPLIARMDADDVSRPDRFAIQVSFLEAHPEVLCVGGRHEYIDSKGRMLRQRLLPTDDATIQRRLLAGDVVICHPSVMMRRDAVEMAGGYDPAWKLAQDLDLWLKLGEIGKLANVPELILRYRLHETSVGSKSHAMQVSNLREICAHACKRRGVEVEFLNKGWLPTNRRETYESMRKRWWWGFMRGDRQMALAYAWQAIRTMPFRPNGWWLLVRAATMREKSGSRED